MPQWIIEPKTPSPSKDVTVQDISILQRFWAHSSDRFEIREYQPSDHKEVVEIFSLGMISHGDAYGNLDLGIIHNGQRLEMTPEDHTKGFEVYVNWSKLNDLSEIETYWGRPRCFFLVAVEKSTGQIAGCVGIQSLSGYSDSYASALAGKLDSLNISSDMDAFAEMYAPEDKSRELFIQRSKDRLLKNENNCDTLYREAELRRMSVKGCYQGTGVAQMILQKALERAKKEGYDAVHLTTSCTMRSAVRFYKKCEFDFIYITIDTSTNDAKLPIAHMRWPLTERSAQIKAFEDAPPMEIFREF